MTIYQEMVDAGIVPENWQSDMYVPMNAKTKEIISRYEFKKNVTMFIDNIDKETWYKIPCAYDPFWMKR